MKVAKFVYFRETNLSIKLGGVRHAYEYSLPVDELGGRKSGHILFSWHFLICNHSVHLTKHQMKFQPTGTDQSPEGTKEPAPTSTDPEPPEIAISETGTPTDLGWSNLLDEDCYGFLWFKLYAWIAIMISFCVAARYLLAVSGASNATALTIFSWTPKAIIHSELYMVPCYVFETYFGRRRYGSSSLLSKYTTAALVVWALGSATWGALSTFGMGSVVF